MSEDERKDVDTEEGKVVDFPGNGDSGEKQGEGEQPPVEPPAGGETGGQPEGDGQPAPAATEDSNVIKKARTGVLIMIDENGSLGLTTDIPMELEKKATMNDVEIMLIQALESIRQQRTVAMVRDVVRREIAHSAPHTADHIVNCLHKKAVEEAQGRAKGLFVPGR